MTLFVLVGDGRRWLIPAAAVEARTASTLGGIEVLGVRDRAGRRSTRSSTAATGRPRIAARSGGASEAVKRVAAVNALAQPSAGSNPVSPIRRLSPTRELRSAASDLGQAPDHGPDRAVRRGRLDRRPAAVRPTARPGDHGADRAPADRLRSMRDPRPTPAGGPRPRARSTSRAITVASGSRSGSRSARAVRDRRARDRRLRARAHVRHRPHRPARRAGARPRPSGDAAAVAEADPSYNPYARED